MKNKQKILSSFAIRLTIFFVLLNSAVFVSAQCGTYFKTSYRKIVPTGIYKTEDWNGDGKLDFWRYVYNPGTSSQNIVVYYNTGNGDWNWDNPVTFTTPIPAFTNSPFLDNQYIVDLDGDGKKDILAAPMPGRSNTFYRNLGNNNFTFTPTQEVPDLQLMRNIGFVDLNNDNMLDWVSISLESKTGFSVGYRLANLNGTFGDFVHILVLGTDSSAQNTSGVPGDFNGDGKMDIVLNSDGHNYRVLINNGGGNFTPGNIVQINNWTYFEDVKDFNNDGKADILASKGYNSNPTPATPAQVKIYYGQAGGTLNEVVYPLYDSTVSFVNVLVGELNGDNNPDLLQYNRAAGSPSYTNSYSAFLNNGSGGFTRVDYNRNLANISEGSFADFNGDGKTDILLKDPPGYYTGGFKNMFGEQVLNIQYPQCNPAGATRFPEFHGDGVNDLVIWNPNTGLWRSRNAEFQTPNNVPVKQFTWGTLGDIPAPGDFDADGKTDYAVYRGGEGNWYIYLSSNNSWQVVRFGLAGDVPVPADYDGGGKTDIAVFRPSDGNWHLLSSETGLYSVIHFGANGDKPVPEDYDGDGKTDLAVFRPSDGNWYYFKSSDLNYNVIHWGIDTDKPIPADYDGDGRADLAVYRGGDWYILRSSNNSFNFFHWGAATDFPSRVYDNSESAAPVVYRPTTGAWYNYEIQQYLIHFNASQHVPIYFGLPNN